MPPKQVLVVDDEPLLKSIVLQKFKSQINNNEMQFFFATNGIEALETLKQNEEVGVVITDLNMPEMDGLSLLAQLEKQNRLYRTVVVSAYNDLTNIRTAMNRGASDFITKPVNLNDLEITLLKTLEQYQYMKKALMAEHQMVEWNNELKIAGSIQQSLVPRDFNLFPNNRNFEILGETVPAKEIGSDFFDFFAIDTTHIGFIIADVAEKGIPAALFMTMSKALIRATSSTEKSTQECIRRVNHLLCIDNKSSMFVTAFYGILDIETGVLKYCNGGHMAPYVISEDGSFKQIGQGDGIALGVVDDFGKGGSQYEEKAVTLKKNDCLCLYTNGIIEAVNGKREFFGKQRLETLLKKSIRKPLSQIIEDLKKNLEEFHNGTKQTDDISVFFLRYHK